MILQATSGKNSPIVQRLRVQAFPVAAMPRKFAAQDLNLGESTTVRNLGGKNPGKICCLEHK